MKVQKGIPDGQTAQLDNRDVWLAKFHFRALSPPEHSEKLSDCHLAIGRPPDKPVIGFSNGDMAAGVARQARQIGIEFASGLVDASRFIMLFRPARDIFIQCRYQTHVHFS